MNDLKKNCFWLVMLIAGLAATSCKNTANKGFLPDSAEYKQPVSEPLVFSEPKKIDWAGLKEVSVHPLVKNFDLDKLPSGSYDTAGFKPFKYPVEESRVDLNALPARDLDISKLPSKALKFKTEKLPPPRVISLGPLRLKNFDLRLFEAGGPHGLEGSLITCLFKDHDGFLWIATNKGIYKYNGEDLLLYVAGNFDFKTFIFSMVQDKSGRIWMGTLRNGLEVLDPLNGTLKKADKFSGLGNTVNYRILQDRQQRIWLGGEGGINIIDPKTQKIQWVDDKHGLADTIAEAIVQDTSGNIWVATTAGGINIFDLKKNKIRYFDKAHGLKLDSAQIILFDKQGRLWMASFDGNINVLDIKKSTIKSIKEAQFHSAEILGLTQDNKGRVWIGSISNGIKIIDPKNNTIKAIKQRDGLSGGQVICLTPDNRGQMWIGTDKGLNMVNGSNAVVEHIGKEQVNILMEDERGLMWDQLFNNGIDIIDRKSKSVRHLGARQGLGNDTVFEMYFGKGKVYLTTNNGLDIIDSSKRTITHIGEQQGLSSKRSFDVVADKLGRVWIRGTNGLSVYDPETGKLKDINNAGLGTSIGNIATDPQGQIWLTKNSNEIVVIDPATWTMKSIRNKVPALKDQVNRVILPDENGNIWIGADKGICVADLKNKTITSFSIPQGLIDEQIATLLERDGKIYAVTVHGITVISPPAEGIIANKKWGTESFGNEYALNKLNPSYFITDAISKDGHLLWGDYGVTVLDLSKKDTLIAPCYVTGMRVMDQAKDFTGSSSSASKGVAWDKADGPYSMPVNLKLSFDRNYVQFSYSALNLVPRDTTWYRYRLIGADENWSEKTEAKISRNYFNLPPGKYTFEAISKNADNGWSKPASLSFIITPPWWQTWWAYLSYVFLLGGTIWGFVAYRSRQLIREKRELEHKVHIRTEEVLQQKEEIEAQRDDLEKAFTELKTTQTQLVQSEKMASLGELTAGIAHEIQNPINFVNNFSEVSVELLDELKDEAKTGNNNGVIEIADNIAVNLEKIRHHGMRADGIVKSMLQHSRAGSNAKEPTDINKLADEYLRLSYHGLRAKDKSFNATLVTHFDETLPKLNVVSQDIGRVMLNLFNNAFYAVQQKQTTTGPDYKPTVETETFFLPGQGVGGIKVRDNGTGIPAAIKDKIMQPFFTTKPTGEGTGLGLSLTYDMVVKGHGGKIELNTKEGEFTEFIIYLPI